MSDMGLGGDSGALPWWQRLGVLATMGASGEGLRSKAPAMPPQGIPGTLSGVVDPNVGGQGQGAPTGNSGPPWGNLADSLTRRPPGGMGLLDTLNPVPRAQQFWDRFKSANDKAFGPQPQVPPSGLAGVVGTGMPTSAPQAAVPPPQLPQGNLQPTALNEPVPNRVQTMRMPALAGGTSPGIGQFTPQQPPSQPQQMPAIPPASPVGRTQAAQGQGNPLDQYFQQMMAMQRQRQLLAMAGGLLGAPSFGQGLSRAFTNASETMAPQGDLVSRIAGAQAAGQLAGQIPHATKEDIQAAQLQGLFGKPFEPPHFEKYEHGSKTFGISPAGRRYDAGSGLSTWAHEMGFRDQTGNVTPDYNNAAKKTVGDKIYYRMSDGSWRDPFAPSEVQ